MVKPSFDYYAGKYALCRTCKARPCLCVAAATGPLLVEVKKDTSSTLPQQASSGNAIPFVIWDRIIPEYGLTLAQGAVLLYCCRKTIGYGRHGGDRLSVRDIAAALNISKATAARAVGDLVAMQLLSVTVLSRHSAGERAWTVIRVTLPSG